MGILVALLIGGGVAAVWSLIRLRSSSGQHLDAGAVSESWLREQRAEKRQDRFSS